MLRAWQSWHSTIFVLESKKNPDAAVPQYVQVGAMNNATTLAGSETAPTRKGTAGNVTLGVVLHTAYF